MGSLIQIFRVPSNILMILLNGIYSALTGQEYSDLKEYPKWMDVVALTFWVYLAFFMYNTYAFNKVYYVYACRDDSSSKCYKVLADYVGPECDSGDDSGSSCTDPTFVAIHFNNGGYIELDCEKDKDKWLCDASNDEGSWTLQIAEIVKVKK